jgi:peptide/nickel transport system ATP-binding protein
MIAMALLFTPQLVIMDEPTSALDVVAQRSLMTKVKDLQRRLGFAVIFVTHDMSVVSRYADRVMVMYAGQIAEAAATDAIFERPLHPYTEGLMSAFPSISGPRRELVGISGRPPDLADPPSGCRFNPRCSKVMPECLSHAPELYRVGGADVRCLLYAERAARAGRTTEAG